MTSFTFASMEFVCIKEV